MNEYLYVAFMDENNFNSIIIGKANNYLIALYKYILLTKEVKNCVIL